MKKLMIMLFVPAFIFGVLVSCGGGGKEYSEEADATEEAPEGAEEEGPTYSGNTAVGVVHSVADLAKWIEVYEEGVDPNAHISYYVNVDNPDEIVVFNLTTSHAEAKEGFADDEMKATMERAGVTSEPVFTYYDMQYMNQTATEATYRVGFSHEVADYDAWKEKFDADEDRRTEMGMELRALARDGDNPNLIHIYFATNDLEPVKAMLGDPEMKRIMEEAGVISEPVAAFWQIPNM
jgi:hypothetical protein